MSQRMEILLAEADDVLDTLPSDPGLSAVIWLALGFAEVSRIAVRIITINRS